jgi:hypothetical protein
MPLTQSPNREAAILTRLVGADGLDFSAEAARAILAIDFGPSDKSRMRQLSAKAREGTLSHDEQAEIDSYERVGHFLNILQSKARRSLRGHRDKDGGAKTSR